MGSFRFCKEDKDFFIYKNKKARQDYQAFIHIRKNFLVQKFASPVN